jgi:hypothetical protein
MPKFESYTPSPSVAEVRDMVSVPGTEADLVDELVYTALGMYNDSDYIGIAETVTDLGGVAYFAKAEARLNTLEVSMQGNQNMLAMWDDLQLAEQRREGTDDILRNLQRQDKENEIFVYDRAYAAEAKELKIEQEIAKTDFNL